MTSESRFELEMGKIPLSARWNSHENPTEWKKDEKNVIFKIVL